jgi:hypothetical protein
MVMLIIIIIAIISLFTLNIQKSVAIINRYNYTVNINNTFIFKYTMIFILKMLK